MTTPAKMLDDVSAAITHDEIGMAYGQFAGHVLRSAYQPVYRLYAGRLAIVAARALVRPSRDGRAADPARFLRSVEASDRLMLECLCRSVQIANLPFVDLETRTLALRLGAMTPDQLDIILACLRAASDALADDGFERPRIVCELDSDGTPDFAAAAARIKKAGFRVALCDVGPKRAGIAAALTTKPDYVRFEGAWFRAVAALPDAQELLTRLAARLHAQEIEVLIDGIETTGHFQVAREVGADMLQGFLFAPPVLAGAAFRQRPLRLLELLQPRAKIIPLRRPA